MLRRISKNEIEKLQKSPNLKKNFNKVKFDFVDSAGFTKLVFENFGNLSTAQTNKLGFSKNAILTYDIARELAIIHDRTLRKILLKAYDQLQEITKNGFYISPEISDSQISNLVEESFSIYKNRKLFDLELRKLKSEIYRELINQGATQKQIGSIFANMFQNLHIAVLKKTAGQIVFDKMKTEKREISIKSFNQLRKYPKAFRKDFLIAINYYDDKDLIRFREYLQYVTKGIVLYIQSPHTKITLASLKNYISKKSQDLALEMTNYEIERFPRPLRKEVKEVLNLLLDYGTDEEISAILENIKITFHNLKINL